MAERPIIFSGPMVRALLAGRKTMTRRPATSPLRKCQIGDLLWVRESYAPGDPGPMGYKADHPTERWGWRPAIHMPRSVSRLTLVVTSVKVERLQDITEEDARAEGCRPTYPFAEDGTARRDFRTLWNSLHGAGSWDANPEVVAISFHVRRGDG